MKSIYITFGSKNILTNMIKKFPNHNLSLYEGNNDYELVDYDSNESIFKIPIKYNIINVFGQLNVKLDKNVTWITINHDELVILINDLKTLFNNSNHPMNSIIISKEMKNEDRINITSYWNDISEANTWFKNKDSDFITKYKSTDNDYLSTNYLNIN